MFSDNPLQGLQMTFREFHMHGLSGYLAPCIEISMQKGSKEHS